MSRLPRAPEPAFTLVDHLEELRRRLLWCGFFWLGATLLALFAARPAIQWLQTPAMGLHLQFVITRPTEMVQVYAKVALGMGWAISLPFFLYHAWAFIKPAFTPAPRLLPWLTTATVMAGFLLGGWSAFTWGLPLALRFLMGLAQPLALPMLTLNYYISFALALCLTGSLICQIPVVTSLLTHIGWITPAILARFRREVYFGMLVGAAVLTPTTDIANLLLFALPMAGLYELGILAARFVHRRRMKRLGLEAAYENA